MFWWERGTEIAFPSNGVFYLADGGGRQGKKKEQKIQAVETQPLAGFSPPDLRLLEAAAMGEGVASFVWVDLPLRIKVPDRRKCALPSPPLDPY